MFCFICKGSGSYILDLKWLAFISDKLGMLLSIFKNIIFFSNITDNLLADL